MSYASDLGLKVGSKIKVVALGNPHACFNVGDVIELMKDDNSQSPWFEDVGEEFNQAPFSLHSHTWEHYKEEEKDMTSAIKIRFPCCVPMSEIKDQETFYKIFALFIANGAEKYETDWEDNKDYGYNYFGVDYDKDTLFYGCVESYSFNDEEDEVTTYSVAELLGLVPKEEPVKDGGWIEWNGEGKRPVLEGTKIDAKFRNGDVELGKSPEGYRWNHINDRDIVAYRLHVSTDTASVASQEAITERLEDNLGVGIDLSKEASSNTTEPLVSIVKDVTYHVSIKGTLFTFTQDELNELTEELLGFSDDF